MELAWRAVTGAEVPRPALRVTGASGWLPSALATEDVALGCVSAALLSAAALSTDVLHPVVASVDRAHVARAVLSERSFAVDGHPALMGFASLSRFWPAADGWVRTHANYPWHRAALLAALGVDDHGGGEGVGEVVAAAIAALPAAHVQEQVFAHGGVAAAVGSEQQWRASEQGGVVDGEDLVGHRMIPGAPPRRREAGPGAAGGIRVLDLTRVIAGPVCTRYLGALGADVLRLDPPAHLDMGEGELADTLLAKTSASLDATTPAGLQRLHQLLDGADVLVAGYRPGALERFGLGDDELAARHGGLVVVRLSAWGHSGPWAKRRGFDSIVQAATGIAAAEGDGERPGALPCQVLDHGTGYLAAAAALDALRRQRAEGGTHVRTLSLARTAHWLLDTEPPAPAPAPREAGDFSVDLTSSRGRVSAIAPPGHLDGRPLLWPEPVSGYLDDEPAWWSTPRG